MLEASAGVLFAIATSNVGFSLLSTVSDVCSVADSWSVVLPTLGGWMTGANSRVRWERKDSAVCLTVSHGVAAAVFVS